MSLQRAGYLAVLILLPFFASHIPLTSANGYSYPVPAVPFSYPVPSREYGKSALYFQAYRIIHRVKESTLQGNRVNSVDSE